MTRAETLELLRNVQAAVQRLKSEAQIRAEGKLYCGRTLLSPARRIAVRRQCLREYREVGAMLEHSLKAH